MKITEYTKKDGSTVYRSSVYLGIDTVTGKKVKTTISGRTKRELKAKALQAQIDFEKDGSTVYKAVEIKTYAELVENWLETYCHTVKKATLTIIKSRLNNYLLPAFGNYRLDKLTPPIIQHQVNQWAKEYNQLGKGYQEYPQLNSLNKRILKYAVSLQVIPFNPARDIIVPRRKAKEGQKLKYLDDDNLKKFLTYLEQLPNTYKNFYDTVQNHQIPRIINQKIAQKLIEKISMTDIAHQLSISTSTVIRKLNDFHFECNFRNLPEIMSWDVETVRGVTVSIGRWR
ncbi:phage integrase: site-specific recombinase [Streptococcus pneumoniae]|nr:phage integrase: site-specific recombinase [Streptococcus pneumoniae]